MKFATLADGHAVSIPEKLEVLLMLLGAPPL